MAAVDGGLWAFGVLVAANFAALRGDSSGPDAIYFLATGLTVFGVLAGLAHNCLFLRWTVRLARRHGSVRGARISTSWRGTPLNSAIDPAKQIGPFDCAVIRFWARWYVVAWSVPLFTLVILLFVDSLSAWFGGVADMGFISSIGVVAVFSLAQRHTR